MYLVHDLTTPEGWNRYKQVSTNNYALTTMATAQEKWQTSGDLRAYLVYVTRQALAIGLASKCPGRLT